MSTEKDTNKMMNDTFQPSQSQSQSQASEYKQESEQTALNRLDTHPPTKTATGWLSEGGHDLTKIQPLSKHRGTSVATFFNGLFTTIIALATLGTSVTFSFVLSNSAQAPAPDSRFDANSVQFFLSLSWLLFLLTLAIASLGSTLLTFFRKHWVRDWDGEHGSRSQLTVQLYAAGISAIMGGLIVTAFIFMCLVVAAYQPAVGWISLGFTSCFGIVVVICICNQIPWPWIQGRTPSQRHCDRREMA